MFFFSFLSFFFFSLNFMQLRKLANNICKINHLWVIGCISLTIYYSNYYFFFFLTEKYCILHRVFFCFLKFHINVCKITKIMAKVICEITTRWCKWTDLLTPLITPFKKNKTKKNTSYCWQQWLPNKNCKMKVK